MVRINKNNGIKWLALVLIYIDCVKSVQAFTLVDQMNNTSVAPPYGRNSISDPTRIWVDTNSICLTPECVHVSSTILNKMNLNVNPCVDFYEFACGKFVKETILAEGKTSTNTLESMTDDLRNSLRKILEEPVQPNEIKPFVQVKEFYSTCMNKTAIEERGVTPLLDVLKSLGGFPVLLGQDWNEMSFSWVETIKKFRAIGIPFNQIFRLVVTPDNRDPTKRTLEIDQPVFYLSKEFLVKGRTDLNVQAYYKYLRDLSVLLGTDNQTATKDMSDVIDFEIALANISSPKEERRNVTLLYNPTKLKDLQQKYPYIDWTDYFNGILPSDIILDENEIVNVVDLRFFDKLGQLLGQTPKRTLANFLLGRVSSTSVRYLTNNLRSIRQEYLEIVYGQTEEDPRWRECTDLVIDRLPVSTSAMYVRHNFNQDSKKVATELVGYIREEFENVLKSVKWMDEGTRIEAVKKLKAMFTLIAYPDELDDNQIMITYHAPLTIENNKLLESIYKITTFTTNIELCKLRKPTARDDWEGWALAAQVNAFYEATYNRMEYPAGILRGHFFSAIRPQYLNYGGIGLVIGHEITHGFDDLGNQFDEVGNLRDWWNPLTKQLFKEKAKCIIDQYSNTKDPQTGLYLNGVATQGENIADNGGNKVAYYAYKRYVEKNGDERTLPGLNYSPEQLFWIYAGQTHCGKFKTEALKVYIEENSHSPNRYRVLLPFQNSLEFSTDFKCPQGTPMNPAKKCEMW